jgi:flagellar FliJ protein
MTTRPDAALEMVLEQRRGLLEEAQRELAARERAVAEEAQQLVLCEARVTSARRDLASEQGVAHGTRLDVGRLIELEAHLVRCESAVADQAARVEAARSRAEEARAEVVSAHQDVRALEVVLEARVAARLEEARRREAREANEIAARVHARWQGKGSPL